MRISRLAAVAGSIALAAAVSGAVVSTTASNAATPAAAPKFDHVVIAIFENKNYADIASGQDAKYFQQLGGEGALFDQSFAITHPSEPNYLALFSGDTQGVTDDSCPLSFPGKDNLGKQLLDKKLSFAAYSEDLPNAGYDGCKSGKYARKHAPWTNFDTVPGNLSVPYTDFPQDFGQLPTVSFVVPNLCDDMHDCDVATGDSWAKKNLDAYAQWAKTHNSLLITTFDEDDGSSVNQIYTSFVGQNVKPGKYSEQIDHYRVLRTVEDVYGLPPLGNAAQAQPITDVWGGGTR